MDGQQLYCQTHGCSQPADPDTGQHKEKLKVTFITSLIQYVLFHLIDCEASQSFALSTKIVLGFVKRFCKLK